jgi:hypothetical protein
VFLDFWLCGLYCIDVMMPDSSGTLDQPDGNGSIYNKNSIYMICVCAFHVASM